MMGWGSGNIGGGGGGLNFSVKQYANTDNLPSFANENTIAIISAETMTGWAFDAVAPVDPAEGMVWMEHGNASGVAFNAAKKNCVMIYPLSAKQYIGGAWVDVGAKSWQDGAWVDWWIPGTLFANGTDDTDLTGGWDSFAYSVGSGYDGRKVNVDISSEGISASLLSARLKSTFVGTNNRVDVSSYTTLTMSFSEARRSTASGAIKVVLYSDAGYTVAAEAAVISTSGQTFLDPEIDVSNLNGSYFIGFLMWAWDTCDLSARMTLARLS